MLILIVFASMQPGEALALRWKDILTDRIVVDERVYDGEFDDVKTDAGNARSRSINGVSYSLRCSERGPATRSSASRTTSYLPTNRVSRLIGTICSTGM
jgi:hypothetical protein